jgi:hypothetical protein
VTATNATLCVPATATQEALWWAHQRAKDTSVHDITWRMAADAAPDRQAPRVARQAVADRHETQPIALELRDGAVTLAFQPYVTAEPQYVKVDDPGPSRRCSGPSPSASRSAPPPLTAHRSRDWSGRPTPTSTSAWRTVTGGRRTAAMPPPW